MTNWPGQSWRLALGNSALSLTVPVVWSTWLSITSTLPLSSAVLPSGPSASTGNGPSARPLVELRQILLRQVEEHRDRLKLGDDDDAGRVRRPHQVALVDQPDAGAAGDRRDDVGIGENGARIVDHGLIELDQRLELLDQRLLGVELLLVDGIGGGKPGVAFEIEPGIGELRFVLRLLGHRLIVLRLIGGRIDLGEHEALRNVLAFGEGNVDELAVDLRAHGHGIERARGADAVEIDRHVGRLGGDREHRNRLRRRRCAPPPRRLLFCATSCFGASGM